MSVQIEDHFDVAFFGDIEDVVADIVNFREEFLGAFLPPPIEVPPTKRAAIVAVNNAIWVDHGEDLKDKVIPEQSGLGFLRGDELQELMHHPAGDSLPGMRTSQHHNCWEILGHRADMGEVGYCQELQPITHQRNARQPALEDGLASLLEMGQEAGEIGACVGDVIGEVDLH
jgi:hypothetical protein